jgi:hypothetical protein
MCTWCNVSHEWEENGRRINFFDDLNHVCGGLGTVVLDSTSGFGDKPVYIMQGGLLLWQ